jgi:hypothetical protein
MKKLTVATIAYNKFSILEKSLNSFIEKSKIKDKRHILIDNIYPYGNSKKLNDFCIQNNIEYKNYDKNIGLFNSMDEIQKECNEDDYIILHEGNNIILDYGFDEALINSYDVLKEKDIDLLISLSNEFSDSLKIFEKDNIKYSVENDGDKKQTSKPKGFPYGGINLIRKNELIKIANYFKNIFFGDPYINYTRDNRIVYILRSHREFSHAYYNEENIEYKMYKMITVLLGYKKPFEDFLKLCDENMEYIYMMINRLDRKIWEYIGYNPGKPIIRSSVDE